MYFFLSIISILKSFNPYFRKHILITFESDEYLFLNSFFLTLFILIFFIYKCVFHNKVIDKFLNKIQNLSILQICLFLIISFITVTTSIVLINIDKHHNTPLLNSLFSKIVSTILLLAVGIFIFKESYNHKQLLGVLFTVIGLFLITYK